MHREQQTGTHRIDDLERLLHRGVPGARNRDGFDILIGESLEERLIRGVVFSERRGTRVHIQSVASKIVQMCGSRTIVELPQIRILIGQQFIERNLQRRVERRIITVIIQTVVMHGVTGHGSVDESRVRTEHDGARTGRDDVLDSFDVRQIVVERDLTMRIVPNERLDAIAHLLLGGLRAVDGIAWLAEGDRRAFHDECIGPRVRLEERTGVMLKKSVETNVARVRDDRVRRDDAQTGRTVGIVVYGHDRDRDGTDTHDAVGLHAGNRPSMAAILAIRREIEIVVHVHGFEHPLGVLRSVDGDGGIDIIEHLGMVEMRMRDEDRTVRIRVRRPVVTGHVYRAVEYRRQIRYVALRDEIGEISGLLGSGRVIFATAVEHDAAIAIGHLDEIASDRADAPVERDARFVAQIVIP